MEKPKENCIERLEGTIIKSKEIVLDHFHFRADQCATIGQSKTKQNQF